MKTYYVYIIYDLKNKMCYIGSRGTHTFPEDDIGFTYFSSSSNKEFIKRQKEHPEEFYYEILFVTSRYKSALSKEIELHQKFDVKDNPLFYNKANQNSSKFYLSKEAKQKQKEALKKIHHQQGFRNSQYGTKWVCNNKTGECRKLKKEVPTPKGWVRGRKPTLQN